MFRTVFVKAAGLAMLPFIRTAVAQTGEGSGGDYVYRHGPGMMWGSESWGGYAMILGPLFMILVLAVLVVGILFLLRAMGVAGLGRNAGARPQDPLTLLQERYARGEIDTQEFEERRRILTQ